MKAAPISIPPGPVIVDLAGTGLDAADRERLLHPAAGGVILFARNYDNRRQLELLCARIRALREPALIITVDQEGGRVQRFRDGFVRLPCAAAFGRCYERDKALGEQLARQAGWLMAVELLAVGVDLSFAPVLDVATVASGVIGDRAFHRDPQIVARLAAAYARGMRAAGMPATGKHFPGHGGVSADSHRELPVDGRPRETIEACDLVPFRALIEDRLEAVMTAHVQYRQVDMQPPTFSRHWLQTVLRQRLGFAGVIFSDDLTMQGAAGGGTPAGRARAALAAGCDMLLVCNDPSAADSVLEAMAGTGPARWPGGRTRLAADFRQVDPAQHRAACAALAALAD